MSDRRGRLKITTTSEQLLRKLGTDFARYSGIRPENLVGPGVMTLSSCQEELKTIFDRNTLLVGHSLENDLRAMRVSFDL